MPGSSRGMFSSELKKSFWLNSAYFLFELL